MKKINFLFLSIVLLCVACNNSPNTTTNNASRKTADSLYDEVMEGHNVGMAKMSKLEKAQKEANRLLDSISKLPAAAKQTMAAYKIKLDSLITELGYAEFAMNKWMDEMNWESDTIEVEKRIKYLSDEKMKVNKVKEAILGSLQKADSLLKVKI